MYDARKRSPVTLISGEDFLHSIEFEPVLAGTGRTISSAASACFDADSGEANDDVAPDAPTVNGTRVIVRLVGASIGAARKLYVLASTNTGEIIGHLLEVEVV